MHAHLFDDCVSSHAHIFDDRVSSGVRCMHTYLVIVLAVVSGACLHTQVAVHSNTSVKTQLLI